MHVFQIFLRSSDDAADHITVCTTEGWSPKLKHVGCQRSFAYVQILGFINLLIIQPKLQYHFHILQFILPTQRSHFILGREKMSKSLKIVLEGAKLSY